MHSSETIAASRDSWGVHVSLLLIIAATGVFALWRSTSYGLGLVNDSAAYIGGAMNILDGNGYARISGGGEVKPITHFPPLFSLLLAGAGLLGLDMLDAARVTILLLFGIDILLVGLSVYKISKSVIFASLGAYLLAVSDIHMGVYSVALSEPLFITLMLVAYLLLAEYFEHLRWQWLSLAGVAIGLSYLTRYAGISVLITAILTLLYLHVNGTRTRRSTLFKEIGILLISSLPLIVLWMGYSQFAAGTVSNRQVIWHPVPFSKIFEGLKNLLSWIAPDDLLAIQPFFGRLLSGISLLLLPTLLLALGGWWVHKRRALYLMPERETGAGASLSVALAIHILVYAGFIWVSLSFFDATSPLDDRILSIIYVPALILMSGGLASLWQRYGERTNVLRWGIAFFSLVLILYSTKDGMHTVAQLSKDGQGFAYQGWRESKAIQAIQEMPPVIIYSDNPNGIFFWTGRSSYIVPSPIDAVTTRPRTDYQAELERMHTLIQAGDAVLILFDLQHSTDPADQLHFSELTRGLALRADYGEAMIFATEP
jgi:4-amino-4-deoxy-L-arabinose transferase-like glycosyltransferase